MIGELSIGLLVGGYFLGMAVYLILCLLGSFLLSRFKSLRIRVQHRYALHVEADKRFILSFIKMLIWPITIIFFVIWLVGITIIELYRQYCMIHNRLWQTEIFEEK